MTDKNILQYTKEDYANMQRTYYNGSTHIMQIVNHTNHNANPDYWNVLLSPLTAMGDCSDKVVLDFGCGCGRNVQNILNKYNVKEAHGCDISHTNVEYSRGYVTETTGKTNHKFFTTDGFSLQPAEDNTYDFIMSTIVLQHICVYSIRYGILSDMYRCLKPGGVLSIQMGFGYGHPNTADYYEDAFYAQSTNSGHDVRITDIEQPISDLQQIGFKDVVTYISHPWDDSHQNWIYLKGIK